MNISITQIIANGIRFRRIASLALLPVAYEVGAAVRPRPVVIIPKPIVSRPYLALSEPGPLRFSLPPPHYAEVPPLREPPSESAPPAPTPPAIVQTNTTKSVVSEANESPAELEAVVAAPAPAATVIAPPLPLVSIIPDDTYPPVRVEDLLPYFQYPGHPPSQIVPPPSSATYRQQ